MKRNKLFHFQQTLSSNLSKDEMFYHLNVVMEEMKTVYSYTVSVERGDEVRYNVRYSVSEESRYNTLSANDVIFGVLEAIEADKKSSGNHIIGHKQPPLDVMIELYDPLICKLAKEQHQRWRMLEYEDLCQICRLTLVVLYNKGNNIHKNLLEKSFNNAVLQELKTYVLDYEILSLETKMDGRDDMEKLSLKDTVRDVCEEMEQEEKDIKEKNLAIFEEVKDFILDTIGIRQFEQLFNDYAKGHTDAWSRRKLQTIKTMFDSMGLTLQNFNNKYGGR